MKKVNSVTDCTYCKKCKHCLYSRTYETSCIILGTRGKEIESPCNSIPPMTLIRVDVMYNISPLT